jgi:hypothetical protein
MADGTKFANSTPLHKDSEADEQGTNLVTTSWATVNPLFNHPKSINSKKNYTDSVYLESQEPNRGGKRKCVENRKVSVLLGYG